MTTEVSTSEISEIFNILYNAVYGICKQRGLDTFVIESVADDVQNAVELAISESLTTSLERHS